jgi:uncharacterized protein YndB with AHSA1/START domain
MPKTNLRQHVVIDALPSKVWKVLTSPDYISQYLFEGANLCNCTEGSVLTQFVQNGTEAETIHKGNVLQAVPGVLLKYKLKDENESFILCTYELIPSEDGIELTLYAEGFEDTNEAYFIRLQQTKLLLQKIKWLAEYA